MAHRYRSGDKIVIDTNFSNSSDSKGDVLVAKPNSRTLEPWYVFVINSVGRIVSLPPRSACIQPLPDGVKAKVCYNYVAVGPGQIVPIRLDLSVILPMPLPTGEYNANILYEGRELEVVKFIIE